jgi:predicted ATPase
MLLQPVFEQFTEGFETDDLQAAERLLKTLS